DAHGADGVGPLHNRVHSHVRCGPQLHARRTGSSRRSQGSSHTMEAQSARAFFWVAACGMGVAIGSMAVLGQRDLRPGDPLPGITSTEFTEFRHGVEDFTEVET